MHLDYLRYLAVSLHMRNRKAVELTKVVERKQTAGVLRHAIMQGKIPAPQDPADLERWDFSGVPGFLIGNSLPCVMEMRTLDCKLLISPDSSPFIASDNPVAMLNQFCAHIQDRTGVTGFSKAGLQLVLPLSPKVCLFCYDPKVYKVGNRNDSEVQVPADDVDLVNSLQFQSAEECLYFHDPKLELYVRQLIERFGKLRVPIQDSVREYTNGNEVLLHVIQPAAKLASAWKFCRYRKYITVKPGDRRDEIATYLIGQVMLDIEQNPGNEDIMQRVARIAARHPDR